MPTRKETGDKIDAAAKRKLTAMAARRTAHAKNGFVPDNGSTKETFDAANHTAAGDAFMTAGAKQVGSSMGAMSQSGRRDIFKP